MTWPSEWPNEPGWYWAKQPWMREPEPVKLSYYGPEANRWKCALSRAGLTPESAGATLWGPRIHQPVGANDSCEP